MSFSLSRYELPRMLTVIAWCTMRSRIAVAMTRSPKTSAQPPKLWLLVSEDHRAPFITAGDELKKRLAPARSMGR